MKLREEFSVERSPLEVWEFFDQPERVARCLPGLEEATVVDADNVEIVATQSVGPMSATFKMRVKVLERVPLEFVRFEAVGKSVRGASGNIRINQTVSLRRRESATSIGVDADVVLAGALGSVGQKVVAKQAGKVTSAFAENLRRELSQPSSNRAGLTDDVQSARAEVRSAPRAGASQAEMLQITRESNVRWEKITAVSSVVSTALSALMAVRWWRRDKRLAQDWLEVRKCE